MSSNQILVTIVSRVNRIVLLNPEPGTARFEVKERQIKWISMNSCGVPWHGLP